MNDDILDKENEIADVNRNCGRFADKHQEIDKEIIQIVEGINEIKDWDEERDMYKRLIDLSTSAIRYTTDVQECEEQLDALRNELRELEEQSELT
jgi:uncharacterized coiled-coil DUF342 family protein